MYIALKPCNFGAGHSYFIGDEIPDSVVAPGAAKRLMKSGVITSIPDKAPDNIPESVTESVAENVPENVPDNAPGKKSSGGKSGKRAGKNSGKSAQGPVPEAVPAENAQNPEPVDFPPPEDDESTENEGDG